jgi:hypothetical protein
MPHEPVLLTGKLPKLKPEEAARVAVYLARGDEVIAEYPVQADGQVNLSVDRAEVASAGDLSLVVGPAGMTDTLEGAPELRRVPIEADKVAKARADVKLPLEKLKIDKAVLERWWSWCEWYCVTGDVIGPDGCPVPFARVTVNTVDYLLAKTPRATVTADENGHFTACFNWCQFPYWCWPCWPRWWWCWPWWWEWDMLHVIERIEEQLPRVPVGPGPVEKSFKLPVSRPPSKDLARGEAFATPLKAETRFEADQSRTALISQKLSNPVIRQLFPWHWWCCDDPNICFTVTQGANTVLDEDPVTDTRWCFEEDQPVTLVAHEPVVTRCPGHPPPATGFVWTTVGTTGVNHIHSGYYDGAAGTAQSDMAFYSGLNIFGEFSLAAGVRYYQLIAGRWGGDPARPGATPPAISAAIMPDLTVPAIVLHTDGTVDFVSVFMGPVTHGARAGLYATQEGRASAPAPDWPPIPAFNAAAGDAVFWSFNGLKVSTSASSLIAGSLTGAVTLSMAAYDSGFNPITLPANTDDHLTLEIDNTPLTTAHINDVKVYENAAHGSVEVFSTGTGDCREYQIHAGGQVKLDVTVTDNQEHLERYGVSPEFGHGSGTAWIGERDYQPGFFLPPPYRSPDPGHKAFGGGSEIIEYTPTVSCCYDFRLHVAKRVTNGYGEPGAYTADFWTVLIKILP